MCHPIRRGLKGRRGNTDQYISLLALFLSFIPQVVGCAHQNIGVTVSINTVTGDGAPKARTGLRNHTNSSEARVSCVGATKVRQATAAGPQQKGLLGIDGCVGTVVAGTGGGRGGAGGWALMSHVCAWASPLSFLSFFVSAKLPLFYPPALSFIHPASPRSSHILDAHRARTFSLSHILDTTHSRLSSRQGRLLFSFFYLHAPWHVSTRS